VLGESLLRLSRSNATESHGGCSRDVVSTRGIRSSVRVDLSKKCAQVARNGHQ
jgi:hypothetical protein